MSSALHTCTDGSEFTTPASLAYRKVTLSGARTEVVPHTHAFAHDMIVCSGTVFATLDDVTHTLRSGDVLAVPAHAAHSVALCPCAPSAVLLCVWPVLEARLHVDDLTRGIAR